VLQSTGFGAHWHPLPLITHRDSSGHNPKHSGACSRSPQLNDSQKQPLKPGTQASFTPQVPPHSGASTSPQANDIAIVVLVVDVVLVVVVVAPQEQVSSGISPTTPFKQVSASVEVIGDAALSSQIHSGVH
jgi:hypothetical protein